ncbi:MAG: MFS transporter [archaeon]|nr:MFS transporter [archaeon]
METKQINNGKTKKYFIYLIIFLCLMEILDTYTTVFPTLIGSELKITFFSGLSLNDDQQNSFMQLAIGIAYFGMYLGIFTRVFADITGRRIWLILTAFGMGLGSLFIMLCSDIIQYAVALAFMNIWFSSDTWSIYVMEESPKEKRGSYLTWILLAGISGAIIVMVARGIYITEGSNNWQGVASWGMFGIILAFLGFKIKETGPYMELEEKRKKEGISKVDIIKTLKKPLSEEYRKGLLPVLAIMFLIGFVQSVTSMAEILFTDHFETNPNAYLLMMVFVMIWSMLGNALIGPLMDKFGRKPLNIVFASLAPIFMFIYVFVLLSGSSNLILMSNLSGISMTCVTGVLLTTKTTGYEVVPTEIRGAATSWMAFVRAVGGQLAIIISAGLTLLVTLGWSTAIITTFIVIAIPITVKYGRETKGIDLKDIK